MYSRFWYNGEEDIYEKTNDEAVRYDQIKKVFICGTGRGVQIDTYDGNRYYIDTTGEEESKKIFSEIVNFGESYKPHLNYTRTHHPLDQIYSGDKNEK